MEGRLPDSDNRIGIGWQRQRGEVLRRIDGARFAISAQSQFRPAGHVQLPENVIEIFFHRTFRQTQLVGDDFIGLGLSHQIYDLPFAEGQDGA